MNTRFLPLAFFLLASASGGQAATWTAVRSLAPSGAGAMMLLTDGTVMIQEADRIHWMRLTPDSLGSYANGSWSLNPINPMSIPRLYFASNMLPSGKVFVIGGEYSGTALPRNHSGTGEIYDPVANTWTPISTYPNQTGCPNIAQFGGTLTKGSAIISGILTTAKLAGRLVHHRYGIAAGTVIMSVDSPSKFTFPRMLP